MTALISRGAADVHSARTGRLLPEASRRDQLDVSSAPPAGPSPRLAGGATPRSKRVHFERRTRYTPCGFYQWAVRTTTSHEAITCKICRKFVAKWPDAV